jgi:nucleotide-binding universal stress UspA family protein
MQNILVPIDFSELAKNALKVAIKIARPMNCKITLFYSVYPVFITSDVGGYIYTEAAEKEEINALNKEMNEWIEFVKAQNVMADKIIQKGLLEDDIVEIVEKEKIDMIVTGTHGAKGLEAVVFGTNSEKIFEKVTCPVLIVPEGSKYHGIKKIMYATDFQYKDINEIEKISKLAKPFNAQIVIAHVDSNLDEFIHENDTMDWFSEIGDVRINYKNILYQRLYGQDINETLSKAAEEMDIDILCMSTVDRNFLKAIFHKSKTKEMAFHANIPLMLLHLSEENRLK